MTSPISHDEAFALICAIPSMPRETFAKLTQYFTQLCQASQWRDMDTAPKTGVKILLRIEFDDDSQPLGVGAGVITAAWEDETGTWTNAGWWCRVTGWLPVPELGPIRTSRVSPYPRAEIGTTRCERCIQKAEKGSWAGYYVQECWLLPMAKERVFGPYCSRHCAVRLKFAHPNAIRSKTYTLGHYLARHAKRALPNRILPTMPVPEEGSAE